MSAHFTTTTLAGSRVLIEGTDSRGTRDQTIVCSRQWDMISQHFEEEAAKDQFNEAVSEFFAPLLEAVDGLNAAAEIASAPDPMSYMVLREGSPAVEAEDEVIVHLHPSTLALRLINLERFDRLLWVKGELEVLPA